MFKQKIVKLGLVILENVPRMRDKFCSVLKMLWGKLSNFTSNGEMQVI